MEKEALLRLLQERFGPEMTVRVGTLNRLVAVAGEWTVDRLEPSSQAKLETALLDPQALQGTVRILDGDRQTLYLVTGTPIREQSTEPLEAPVQPTSSAPAPSPRLGVPTAEPSESAIPPALAQPTASAATVAQLEARIEQRSQALARLSQTQPATEAIARPGLRHWVEAVQSRAQQSLTDSLLPLRQSLQQVQQTVGQQIKQVKSQVQTTGQQLGSQAAELREQTVALGMQVKTRSVQDLNLIQGAIANQGHAWREGLRQRVAGVATAAAAQVTELAVRLGETTPSGDVVAQSARQEIRAAKGQVTVQERPQHDLAEVYRMAAATVTVKGLEGSQAVARNAFQLGRTRDEVVQMLYQHDPGVKGNLRTADLLTSGVQRQMAAAVKSQQGQPSQAGTSLVQ
jgi:hypothetical protein